MLLAERFDCRKVERISECMGNHDCLCLLGKCFLELCNIDVVLRDRHVNEDRNSAVLDRRGNGRRETCRNSDDKGS